MKEKEIVRIGFICITPCLFGPDSIWRVEGDESRPDDKVYPDVFSTEKDAWKEIIADYITVLQQFIDDERDFEDVDLNGPEDYVAAYLEYDNGEFEVRQVGTGELVMKATLNMWRETL